MKNPRMIFFVVIFICIVSFSQQNIAQTTKNISGELREIVNLYPKR